VAQAGLGRALALQCVLPERSLGLLGRDKARIAEVCATCAPAAPRRRRAPSTFWTEQRPVPPMWSAPRGLSALGCAVSPAHSAYRIGSGEPAPASGMPQSRGEPPPARARLMSM